MQDSEGHRHYWKPIGAKGSTWSRGHALGRCVHKGCDAWTVLGYGEGTGPCPHVVSRDTPQELLEEVFLDRTKHTLADLEMMDEEPQDL